MKLSTTSLAFVGCLVASSPGFAQAPAASPSGSTGLCKDGSYTSNETKKGACTGHKGVKDWYGAKPVAAEAPVKPAISATAPVAPDTKTPTTTAKPALPTAAPAAGGGPGQVWVNSSTKVYHCVGTKYYGKTKQGEYLAEAVAKAAGNHADHGKAYS